ncbi:MAG: PE-PGRS family protein, partial [Myxococcales bacterium]|nr:PE-PGRS family protein [Myxococcales bacterium]
MPRLLGPCLFSVAVSSLVWGCAEGDAPITGGGGSTGTAGSTAGGSDGAGGTPDTGGAGEGGMPNIGGGGEGGGGDCTTCPPGTQDLDQNPITGECGCEYVCTPTGSEDPIDGDFTDDNCDGSDGVVEQCVYVSAGTGNDTTGTGGRDAPVQSITRAFEIAQANDVPAVCLSGEVYSGTLTLISGISVYGGFDHTDEDFPFRRKAGIVTTINAEGTGVIAGQIDEETHLEGLTIEVTASPAQTSNYGVRLSGGLAQLYVRYNIINVAGGVDGADGA